MENEFRITLPASASLDIYPGNTLSEYTVRLHKPLFFEQPYEVGVEDFHCFSKILNVGSDESKIVFRVYDDSPDRIKKKKIKLKTDKLVDLKIKLPSLPNVPTHLFINRLNQLLAADNSTEDLVFVKNDNNNKYSLRELNVYNTNNVESIMKFSPGLQVLFGVKETQYLDELRDILLPSPFVTIPQGEFVKVNRWGARLNHLPGPEEKESAERALTRDISLVTNVTIKLHDSHYDTLSDILDELNTKLSRNSDTTDMQFIFRDEKVHMYTDSIFNRYNLWTTVSFTEELKAFFQLIKVNTIYFNGRTLLTPKLTDKISFKDPQAIVINRFRRLLGLEPKVERKIDVSIKDPSEFKIETILPIGRGNYGLSEFVEVLNASLASSIETDDLQFTYTNPILQLQSNSLYRKIILDTCVKLSPALRELFRLLESDYVDYSEVKNTVYDKLINIPAGETLSVKRIERVDVHTVPYVRETIVIKPPHTERKKKRRRDIAHKRIENELDSDLKSETTFSIEAKNYATLSELVAVINLECKKNEITNRFEFFLEENNTLLSVRRVAPFTKPLKGEREYALFPSHLAWLLGLRNFTNFINIAEISKIQVENDISHSVARIMYIYTDVIKHGLVGDTSARLLKTIYVETTGVDNTIEMSKSFERVQYSPLDKKFIQDITIYLRDAEGHRFPLGAGGSIVTLHFRKIR